MQKRTLIAGFVVGAIGGLSAHGWAADELPLSVSAAPALAVDLGPPRVGPPQIPDPGNLHPEFFGAAAIGAYTLYRARRRRVV